MTPVESSTINMTTSIDGTKYDRKNERSMEDVLLNGLKRAQESLGGSKHLALRGRPLDIRPRSFLVGLVPHPPH